MGYHPIESLMKVTMDSLKDMVDVNTVVGEPVETKEGTVIIPVSRVSFGFVTGGGDECPSFEGMPKDDPDQGSKGQKAEDSGNGAMLSCDQMPFTGGAGAGVSVRPVGFLVVGGHKVRFLPVDSKALIDRLIEEAPDILSKIRGAVTGRGWGDVRERGRDREGPDGDDGDDGGPPGEERRRNHVRSRRASLEG